MSAAKREARAPRSPGRVSAASTRKAPPTREQQALAAYADGATTREIADQHDVNESSVRGWLHAADIPLRRRGPKDLPISDDMIAEMKAEDYSWQQIADHVGMSRSGVRRRYLRYTGTPYWGTR